MHVILILVYTVLSFLAYNVYSPFKPSVTRDRISTAWYFFGGLQDIFIAFMMFFILDDGVNIVRDEKTKVDYVVLNVINESASEYSD